MDWFSGASGQKSYIIHQDSHHGWQEGSAWTFEGGDANPSWDMNWRITGSAQSGAASGSDHFVNVALAVTNNTNSFQSFSTVVTLNLPEMLTGGTVIDGSVSASVTDVFGDGAELRTFNDLPIYQAVTDESFVAHTLLDPQYSLIASPGGGASDSMTFGDPTPLAGPSTISTISIQIDFELSPYDTANVVGTFRVAQAVPAPAAMPLLAGFMLALGSRRRRRQN
jgi:hypothetical protein